MGVESTLAVIGTGGPVKRGKIYAPTPEDEVHIAISVKAGQRRTLEVAGSVHRASVRLRP
eukprot:6830954-Pyramimonas_sp.AAC.1